MSRGDRKKASDVFRETTYVFAEKVPFETAFPEIASVDVEFTETGHGIWDAGKRYRGYRAGSRDSLGEYIDCSNSLCYNGGFSIGNILREMVRNKETRREFSALCQGNEGSPKGRRIYRKCLNFFKGIITIVYKPQEG